MGQKTVKLNEQYIIITIPENAVGLSITAKILTDKDEIIKVGRDIDFKGVVKARGDFLEYIGDDFDATYVITEKGRQWLEALQKEIKE